MKSHWMVSGVLAIALALGACGDDDDDDSGGFVAEDQDAGSAAATPAAPASGEAIPGGTGDEPLEAQQSGRKIIFTANLSVRSEDVGRSFNDAAALARSHGGYIEKSQYTNDGENSLNRSAAVTIRVPTQNYDSLVASLRGMAGVTVDTEGSNSKEVTEEYTDLQSRQRNLERTEQQYLVLLDQAKSIQEILTVQDRLSGVRSQIEQIQGRLKVLDDLADFATVNVSIAPVIAKVEEPSGGWKLSQVFVESWQGSVEVARYAAAAAIVALVAVAWLGVPAVLVYLVARRVRRGHGTVEAPAEG